MRSMKRYLVFLMLLSSILMLSSLTAAQTSQDSSYSVEMSEPQFVLQDGEITYVNIDISNEGDETRYPIIRISNGAERETLSGTSIKPGVRKRVKIEDEVRDMLSGSEKVNVSLYIEQEILVQSETYGFNKGTTLTGGESMDFEVNDEKHTLKLDYVDGGASFTLDGQEQTELGNEILEGETRQLDGGITIEMLEHGYFREDSENTVTGFARFRIVESSDQSSCSAEIGRAQSHAEGKVCTDQVQRLSCPSGDKTYQARNGCEISYLKNQLGWTAGFDNTDGKSEDSENLDTIRLDEGSDTYSWGDKITVQPPVEINPYWGEGIVAKRFDERSLGNYLIYEDLRENTESSIQEGKSKVLAQDFLIHVCEVRNQGTVGDLVFTAGGMKTTDEVCSSQEDDSAPVQDQDGSNSMKISLSEGWNMISGRKSFEVSHLQEDCDLSSYQDRLVWRYKGNQWQNPDMIEPNGGYYLYAPDSCEAEIEVSDGVPAPEVPEKSLSGGWNMISVSTPKTLSDIKGDCELADQEQPIWHYSGEWERLGSSDDLQPNKGYFVRMQSSCTMSLS